MRSLGCAHQFRATFQAVEGAFSRYGSEQRIAVQAVVIVKIFLVRGEAEDPL